VVSWLHTYIGNNHTYGKTELQGMNSLPVRKTNELETSQSDFRLDVPGIRPHLCYRAAL
jgi:hypothetical protein